MKAFQMLGSKVTFEKNQAKRFSDTNRYSKLIENHIT